MIDTQKELIGIVDNAIKDFNKNEKYLIENDLSERCICARFAMYLTKALYGTNYQDYSVDVEYNRGAFGKDICAKIIENKRIIVDLIVHKRGYDHTNGFDNLICIEMKKTTNHRGCKADEERLRKMTSYSYGFNYKLAAMILINMKKHCLEMKKFFQLG